MLCAVVRGWKLRARRRGKFCDFRFKPLLPARRAQGIERSGVGHFLGSLTDIIKKKYYICK